MPTSCAQCGMEQIHLPTSPVASLLMYLSSIGELAVDACVLPLEGLHSRREVPFSPPLFSLMSTRDVDTVVGEPVTMLDHEVVL